ncbi:hypothetical protein C8J56DRAFT_889397 [Mycena floridula]|nr:hypothetical protein C8J56DRAFT_889397 [Mycena floridula]
MLVILFSITTTYFCLYVAGRFKQMIGCLIDNTDLELLERFEVADSSIQPLHLALSWLSGNGNELMFIFGDGIVVWRVWAVWSDRQSVIILPALTLLATFAKLLEAKEKVTESDYRYGWTGIAVDKERRSIPTREWHGFDGPIPFPGGSSLLFSLSPDIIACQADHRAIGRSEWAARNMRQRSSEASFLNHIGNRKFHKNDQVYGEDCQWSASVFAPDYESHLWARLLGGSIFQTSAKTALNGVSHLMAFPTGTAVIGMSDTVLSASSMHFGELLRSYVRFLSAQIPKNPNSLYGGPIWAVS